MRATLSSAAFMMSSICLESRETNVLISRSFYLKYLSTKYIPPTALYHINGPILSSSLTVLLLQLPQRHSILDRPMSVCPSAVPNILHFTRLRNASDAVTQLNWADKRNPSSQGITMNQCMQSTLSHHPIPSHPIPFPSCMSRIQKMPKFSYVPPLFHLTDVQVSCRIMSSQRKYVQSRS